ncbi:hypothetical protein [Propionicimonas sp.]|uniref:hypothetical protein n=1 Tax=Propionicimonas sp. TaxID=1955623 RepID=UPI0039E27F8D
MTTRQIADAELVARVRYACCTGQAKAIRKASRLSVLVIGGAVGVHHSSVTRWESAAQLPTGRRAVAYGQLLERLNGGPLDPLGGSL